MYALMIARHKLYPQHKKHGMRAIKGQLIMYTSRHVRIPEKKYVVILKEEKNVISSQQKAKKCVCGGIEQKDVADAFLPFFFPF